MYFRWLTKPVVLKETAREHHAVWPGLCPSLSSALPEPFKAIGIQGNSSEIDPLSKLESRSNPGSIQVESKWFFDNFGGI